MLNDRSTMQYNLASSGKARRVDVSVPVLYRNL